MNDDVRTGVSAGLTILTEMKGVMVNNNRGVGGG